MKNLKVVILAGGDSSRLWPIPDKLTISIKDRPLIYYPLDQLIRAGARELIIVGHKKNLSQLVKLKNLFPQALIEIKEQTVEKGMAGAILSVKEMVNNSETLIVGPSDIFEDYLIKEFINLKKDKPDGIMVGKELDYYEPFGYLKVENDEIKGIVEKPPKDKLPSKIVNIVFDYYRNSKSLIEALENIKSNRDDIYEKAKDSLINKGLVFKLLSYNGFWGYFKYPWHLLNISAYFLSQLKNNIAKTAFIAESAVLEGSVFIADDVKILENVKIIGPVFIGKGTLVGQNCLIRESMIGANNIIGFGSEITRSYLGANNWTHGNYLGDSIVLDNCAFGAKAVFANFRLDGKVISCQIMGNKVSTGRTKLGAMLGRNIRIGVNSSIMPGIKIGSNSFIGSQVLVDHDIPDNKYFRWSNHELKTSINKLKLDNGNMNKHRNKLNL